MKHNLYQAIKTTPDWDGKVLDRQRNIFVVVHTDIYRDINVHWAMSRKSGPHRNIKRTGNLVPLECRKNRESCPTGV